MEPEVLDFDLRAMLEDTAELLAMRAHEKGLEFICHVAPETPTFLRGDPGRLRQILVNLGGNAIKFTSQGEVAIEVKLESETDGQIKARFEVRDTGAGIPQDKIGLLFNAFQQVDASTTRRFGGTGLGLAISKRLAGLMGGEVGVESVEGRGSTFWFTAVLGKQPPRERGEGTPGADLRGARVLAVDDNATNRLILAEQLASWDVRHAEAESAAKAIDMLRAACAEDDPFRIVLMDMQMPEMDGESLGRAIKADPELRDTLMVMMASLGKRGDAKRLEAIGFSAYLTKPVKQSQLHDCLAMVLGIGVAPIKAPEIALVTRHTLGEARRRKVRILLAEDNATNQVVALAILEKLGYTADVAANGREALKALATVPYSLVLMDVQMPEMDGYEATRLIRDASTPVLNHGIPIIAMTAHAMKGDRDKCLAAGMDDYVAKPVDRKELAETIERQLGGAAANAKDQTRGLPSVPSVPSQQRIFNAAELLKRVEGDETVARKILDAFLADAPEQIQGLEEAWKSKDAQTMRRRAHSLKGASATIGAAALSQTALRIEEGAEAGRLDEAASFLPALKGEFETLKPALEAWPAGAGSQEEKR